MNQTVLSYIKPSRSLCAVTFLALATASTSLYGQALDTTADSASAPAMVGTTSPAQVVAVKPAKKEWFEKLSLRGYTQIRVSNLFSTNKDLQCSQCDRAIGGTGGFTIRRARIVLSGQVSDRLYVYIQPDFASEVGGRLNSVQLRDIYFDLSLDEKREFRVRVGQAKVPFGWENLQSSSNRLALDRADALNSAIPNERDLGVQVLYTPQRIQKLYKAISDAGLKGTGDYGMIAAGAFNGQGANAADEEGNLQAVMRVSYPFQIGNRQFAEVALQGYSGTYYLPSVSSGITADRERKDYRVAGSFVLYPQPVGLQAEWNTGKGPQFDPVALDVVDGTNSGGYIQTMYRAQIGDQVIIPFLRAQQFKLGKKFELDARSYDVKELEMGVEWLPLKALELTALYTVSDRRYEDLAAPSNRQKGNFLRLQAQFNY